MRSLLLLFALRGGCAALCALCLFSRTSGGARNAEARAAVVLDNLLLPNVGHAARISWRDSVIALRAALQSAPPARQFRALQQFAPKLLRGLAVPVGSARAEAEAELVFTFLVRELRVPRARLVEQARRLALAAPSNTQAMRLYCFATGLDDAHTLEAPDRRMRDAEQCAARAHDVVETWSSLLSDVMIEPPRRLD